MRGVPFDPIAAARAASPVIEAGTAAGESQRTLPRASVDALVDARLFELLVPRCLGGLESDLGTALTVFEEISRADGSAGWCLMAGASSSAIAAAYTGDAAAKEMFEGKRGVIHAGQLAPRGSARAENGGYRVSGNWSFGSGAPHATHLMGGCIGLADGGAPRMLPNGFPEILAVCVPRERAVLKDNWHVIGLEGTGSIDYAFENVMVPSEYAFPLLSTPPRRGGPLYRLGVLGITAAGHAGFAMGVGRRALDEIHKIALAKTRMGQTRLGDQESFQAKLARHEARLRAARAYCYEAFGAAEAAAQAGDVTQESRALVRLATTHVTEAAADAAEFAYRAGGSDALRVPSRLQRAWRDIHAGTQHIFVDERTLIDSARVLLGIAPEGMVI